MALDLQQIASQETLGMFMIVLQGVNLTASLIVGRILKERNIPFYRLQAIAHYAVAFGVFLGIRAAKIELPSRRQCFWVCVRGVFGAGAFLLTSEAVRQGASAGDVAALTSINTVVASLLARAFLNEPFRLVHVVSLCFTMSGALLVTRPEFLLGGSSGATPWLGYAMALTAGVLYAGSFIASRKASEASVWLLTLATVLTCAVVCSIIPLLVDDFSLDPLLDAPGLAAGIVASVVFMTICGWALLCTGSKWCPAAVAATTMTTARIVAGYAAHSIVFLETPEALTIFGAALMLGGVIAVALARREAPVPTQGEADGMEVLPRVPASPSSSLADDDDNVSLASFIAAEYAQATATRPSSQDGVRQRKAALPSVFGAGTDVEVADATASI